MHVWKIIIDIILQLALLRKRLGSKEILKIDY